MQVSRIGTIEEYNEYRKNNEVVEQARFKKEQQIAFNKPNEFTVRGFSYPAGDMVDFHVDHNYSDGKNINWRERVVCPRTGLNNRLRACIHFIDFELGLREYHDVYISEQVTPLYNYLQKQFPKLTGSEYLGTNVDPGCINKNGIRHEDATQLSFPNESLDAYLSFECLEHVPGFTIAFTEAYRVLRKKGKFLFSVPFANLQYKNIIRAFVGDDGKTYHLLEPEYHGDPVSEDGILCYTHFGWEMFDQLRNEGFTNVYALLYWSEIFGYFGGEQIMFIAEK